MRWGMDIDESARPCCKIGARFLGGMGRMIVHDYPNLSINGIVCINLFQQPNEFDASVPVLNLRKYMAIVQVYAS